MKEEFGVNAYLSVLRLILILSSVFIISTVFLGISNLEKLSTFCICKVNYLAYSWISFSISVLLSLVGFVIATSVNSSKKGISLIEKINLVIIIAGFICGLILMIVFAGYILNVL
jgi:hypothetical protein